MRILVDHRTTYSYAKPAGSVVQVLRLTPQNHEGQHVRHWRVDADVNGTMQHGSDAFGNVQTMFYAEGPISSLTLAVSGEVDVQDTAGVVLASENLPSEVYLRSTLLTEADETIRSLAAEVRGPETLASLHALMEALHLRVRFDVGTTNAATPAAKAFSDGHGVCQDFAHIFCSAARTLDIPARYVSGHLAKTEPTEQAASHAWAEAFVDDFGWVAFDPANGICATEAYLRIAIGLDYLDAAPVRGARRGGGSETMSVHVQATDAISQRQS